MTCYSWAFWDKHDLPAPPPYLKWSSSAGDGTHTLLKNALSPRSRLCTGISVVSFTLRPGSAAWALIARCWHCLLCMCAVCATVCGLQHFIHGFIFVFVIMEYVVDQLASSEHPNELNVLLCFFFFWSVISIFFSSVYGVRGIQFFSLPWMVPLFLFFFPIISWDWKPLQSVVWTSKLGFGTFKN